MARWPAVFLAPTGGPPTPWTFVQVGQRYGLPLLSPVDDAGRFTDEAGPFAGLNVQSDGNEAVVRVRPSAQRGVWRGRAGRAGRARGLRFGLSCRAGVLHGCGQARSAPSTFFTEPSAPDPCSQALEAAGVLLKEERYEHKYPYDWRTKKPTIFRATDQVRPAALGLSCVRCSVPAYAASATRACAQHALSFCSPACAQHALSFCSQPPAAHSAVVCVGGGLPRRGAGGHWRRALDPGQRREPHHRHDRGPLRLVHLAPAQVGCAHPRLLLHRLGCAAVDWVGWGAYGSVVLCCAWLGARRLLRHLSVHTLLPRALLAHFACSGTAWQADSCVSPSRPPAQASRC